MSISLVSYIRHDFHDLTNRKEAILFVKKTIENLKKELGLGAYDIEPDIVDFDNYILISFYIQLYEIEVIMRDGFWEIRYDGNRQCQDFGNYLDLRNLSFDFARVTGQDEAWYMEGYHPYDIGAFDITKGNLEQWITEIKKKLKGEIPEFDINHIIHKYDVYLDEPPLAVYHDSLEECKVEFLETQEKLGDVKLLGLYTTGNFYRCEKDGHIILTKRDTLSPFRLKKFDKILHGLYGSEFIIVKGRLSAVFSAGGRQLTKYVEGGFQCTHIRGKRWGEEDRIIYNRNAGIVIFRD